MTWLETHESLSGWAQFLGTMLALGVTYLTAFWPIWRRKRQLRNAGMRLLAHGYEAVESYHRTSSYFDPFPMSLRAAALTMATVAEEMSRFPIYELDDQGSNSLARRLVAMSFTLGSLRLVLESMAEDIDGRSPTEDEKEGLRHLLTQSLANAEALLLAKVMPRPEPLAGPHSSGEVRPEV